MSIKAYSDFPYCVDRPEDVLNQTQYWRESDNRVVDLTCINGSRAKSIMGFLNENAVSLADISLGRNRIWRRTKGCWELPEGYWYDFSRGSKSWIQQSPLYVTLNNIVMGEARCYRKFGWYGGIPVETSC